MAEHLKVVNLEGCLGIDQAAAIKQQFIDSLAGCSGLVVNLARAESLDLSALQVILSAHKSALRQALTFNYAHQLSPAAAQAFYLGGVMPSAEFSGRDLGDAVAAFLAGSDGAP